MWASFSPPNGEIHFQFWPQWGSFSSCQKERSTPFPAPRLSRNRRQRAKRGKTALTAGHNPGQTERESIETTSLSEVQAIKRLITHSLKRQQGQKQENATWWRTGIVGDKGKGSRIWKSLDTPHHFAYRFLSKEYTEGRAEAHWVYFSMVSIF